MSALTLEQQRDIGRQSAIEGMIRKYDCGMLTRDLPDTGLCAGNFGMVMRVHDDCSAYEVEFSPPTAAITGVVTIGVADFEEVDGLITQQYHFRKLRETKERGKLAAPQTTTP